MLAEIVLFYVSLSMIESSEVAMQFVVPVSEFMEYGIGAVPVLYPLDMVPFPPAPSLESPVRTTP